jgi:hypothetical protein
MRVVEMFGGLAICDGSTSVPGISRLHHAGGGEGSDGHRLALETAAFARAALQSERSTPAKMARVDEVAIVYAEALAGREPALSQVNAIHAAQGASGGRAGKGRVKRQHTELIRRAADLLERNGRSPTPAHVRNMLKVGWRQLASDMGDPLADIVRVNVRGSVIDIEYTTRWAARRAKKSVFVEIDDDALAKALSRRA